MNSFKNPMLFLVTGFYSTYQRNDYSSLFDIIQQVDKTDQNLRSINDMTEIKTTLGKVRGFKHVLN